jgi:hypothetical protein
MRLFLVKNADFLKGHFSPCGKTCAFSRTLNPFPETAFCSAMARVFLSFSGLIAAPAMN